MIPPKNKTVDEGTRSNTIPTLSGNYNLDAGNSTKNISLSGELYFPYMGSPDNPIARSNENLSNLRSGLDEFFILRWFLIRYRDYTMTKKGKITNPGNALNLSSQIAALYKAVSSRLGKKVGALYDEIRVIFHDYDMDDHWYCRVDSLQTSQSSEKHIAINYTINIECYEPNSKSNDSTQVKPTTNEQVNTITNMLNYLDYESAYDGIQARLGFNSDFISMLIGVGDRINSIIAENELIQSGKNTAQDNLPLYTTELKEYLRLSKNEFKEAFMSKEQRNDYDAGNKTLDEILEMSLVTFYNTLQKVEIQNNALIGVIKTAPNQNAIRFYSNADAYRLTESQFDSDDENKVENDTSFYYYTVMDGDTSRVIALRELNDTNKFLNILEINQISENDFIDGNLIGKQIKIPILAESITRGDDNLVYEVDTSDIANYLYGKDLATGVNRNILLSGTGDWKGIEGADNAVEKIEIRTSRRKGSLNTFNPGWGILSPDDSNAPLLVKIERYLSSIMEQVRSDPRVEVAQMELARLEYTGEKISVPVKITLVNNEGTEVLVNG